MEGVKRNNWSMYKGLTGEEWYCGDCNKECDDDATVITSTNEGGMISVTCKECHALEQEKLKG